MCCAVTADNVGEYIARVADFRLNVEPSRACAAFISGFHELVSPARLRVRTVWGGVQCALSLPPSLATLAC